MSLRSRCLLLRLKAFDACLESALEEESLDGVDNAIWVLPLLSLLDVVSTFYVQSQGYALERVERGFFASYFVSAGSIYIYVYVVIYLLIMVGIACLLWYIKNKELKPSRRFDRIFFLALVGVVFYVYTRLATTLLMNFFLPIIVQRGIDVFTLTLVLYGSCALSLGIYLWRPVLAWVSYNENKKW
jgi:hypothetical protein